MSKPEVFISVIGAMVSILLSYTFMVVPVFVNAIIVLSIALSVATLRDKNT